jgi:tRNA-splicing ligase RtcB (3'-phosphate/5'-hydroxy nucleic acid ligase)
MKSSEDDFPFPGGPSAGMVVEERPYRELDEGRIRVYGYSYDSQAVTQLRTVLGHGWVRDAALMADNHLGYSMPIGGVAAYRDMVSPSGVGYDIGCGVMAVRTSLALDDVRTDLAGIADGIAARISFGLGRRNPIPVDHPLFDSPVWQEVPELTQRVEGRRGSWSLRSRAEQQLGTVGSGNHYVDLLVEPATGELWAACHFGSRGFGHGVATGFLNVAAGRPFHAGHISAESMHAAPSLLPLTDDAAVELGAADPAALAAAGRRYEAAMRLAGEYAYAGREHVIDQVLHLLGAQALETVHNHHNFAWQEEHGGERVHVVRKGATPAFPGQAGFVGGSMGDWAVVVEGADSPLAERTLRSTVHGAGRVMSRSRARGNRKGTRPGLISRDMMRRRLDEFRRETGYPLEVRGGDVDESPFVYRELDRVVRAHEDTDTIRVVHRLLPVVVCMAGSDVFDPFKD